MKKINLKSILKKTFKKDKSPKKVKKTKALKKTKIKPTKIKKKLKKVTELNKKNVKSIQKNNNLRIPKSGEIKPEIKKIKKQDTENS